jgi:hypothetical protein
MTSQCYQDCANGHKVEDHLAMAIDAEPRFIEAQYQLCDYYYETGEMGKAKGVLLRLFAQDEIIPSVPPTDLCGVDPEVFAGGGSGAEGGAEGGAAGGAMKVSKLHVVTVGNKEWPELEVQCTISTCTKHCTNAPTLIKVLRKSVRASMGLEVEVLGMGKTYPGHAFKVCGVFIVDVSWARVQSMWCIYSRCILGTRSKYVVYL